VRREIEESSGGQADAMLQQRQVVSAVPAEVLDKQVRRPDDRSEEPEGERGHEDGDSDEDDEDRQRRDDQESDEHDGRQFEGAQRTSGCEACQLGVLLELLGG
jgi:hypothetical protein